MSRTLALVLAAPLLVTVSAHAAPGDAAAAAPFAALDAANAQVDAVWETIPFTARHAMLVSRAAELYGDYNPRENRVFAPGEKIRAYVEPIGFTWKAAGPDSYIFGVDVDFEIRTAAGKVLGGREKMLQQVMKSHFRNRELFLNLSIDVAGAPDGDYVLAYTLHDREGGKQTVVELPFTIRKE